MHENKEPDFVFFAKISAQDNSIKNVLCRLYLPTKFIDEIKIHLFPDDKQMDLLKEEKFWKISIEGEVRGNFNKVEEIISGEGYLMGFETNVHGFEFSENIGFVKPINLRIKSLFGHQLVIENTEVFFWITPNQLLEPAQYFTNFGSGKREIKILEQFEFKSDEETKFNFERHFKRYKNEDGDEVTFSELNAKSTIENKDKIDFEIQRRLNQLNDILLLASFAAMQRSICLGWDSCDSNKHIKQYLRDRTLPDISKSKRTITGNEIINLIDFNDFMNKIYPNFIKYREIDALRRVINFLLPTNKETIDGGFMILYSALEMLILQFRREFNIEYILPRKRFEKQIRKRLKTFINELDAEDLDDNKKELIKGKLSELNRVSFASAFEKFCNHYSVNLDDLWQVIDNKDGISLIQIRNKLVHGEHVDSQHYTGLIYAKEHLKWTVQRMILGILGWSMKRSNLSPSSLQNEYAYTKWKEECKLLFK